MQTKLFERLEVAIAYDDNRGDGKPGILLPGTGASRSEYRSSALALLEAGHRAVTTDLGDHGESSVGRRTQAAGAA